ARTVKVTFPDNYHSKDVAGKDAVFECKINSIKHRELPALDEAFVKKVSKFETLADYRADIRKNMEAQAERRAVEAQRTAIIDQAVANMTVDLPPAMVDNRVNQMINELSAQLQTQGMTIEQYMAFSGADMDSMREDYRETARKNVLTDIMLERVADVEKINVEQAELNFEIEMMAQMYRTPPKQIAKYLQENGQLLSVASSIRRRKAIKFILDNSAISTVAPAKEETPAPAEAAKTAEAVETPAEIPAKDEAPQPAEAPKATEPVTEAPETATVDSTAKAN
ncbi:MAG: trigger factor, partial [Selenomonadaceae bacterium]|nr:trigger factor [Selenomonadaceae bacterium]